MNWNRMHFWHPHLEEDTGAAGGDGQQPVSLDQHLKDNPESQKELDRRITKALNTAHEKWEQEAQQRETEAAKLAKMTAEQKAEHERQKREKELSDREAALMLRELHAEAAKTLTEKKLPLILLDCLNYQDAEKCSASIDKVETAFRAAVQAGVEERMRGNIPGGTAGNGGPITKEQIMKEKDYAKRLRLIEEHQDLFVRKG